MKDLILKFKNNKKDLTLLLVASITLIIVTLGATYAYFFMQGDHSGKIDTSIITGTTDLLSFNFGDSIYIQASQDNFGEGIGNYQIVQRVQHYLEQVIQQVVQVQHIIYI